jgi:hypothetical protein
MKYRQFRQLLEAVRRRGLKFSARVLRLAGAVTGGK